jgi:hypothetical protein
VAVLEKSLDDFSKLNGWESLRKELSDNLLSDNFGSILAEGYAAVELLKCRQPDLLGKTINIQFAPAGQKDYDLIYTLEHDAAPYYVSVKTIRSLDPAFDIFHNALLAKHLESESFAFTSWDVTISDYTMDNIKVDSLKVLLRSLIDKALEKYRELGEIPKNGSTVDVDESLGNISISCKVKESSNEKPDVSCSKDTDSLLNTKDKFLRLSNIYTNIYTYIYWAFVT